MRRARVDHPEERAEPAPRAVPQLHRVRVARGILPELLEEASHGVPLDVQRILRDEPLILGKEQEDEAHQRRQETAVDVRRVLHRRPEERPVIHAIGRLEPAEERVEREEHLPREARGDLGLVTPTVLENGRQPLRLEHRKEPRRPEQHDERREHESARRLGHRRDGKRDVPRSLPARRVREAERSLVEKDAHRHPRVAAKALQARLGGRAPGGIGARRVERHPGRQHAHERERRSGIPHNEVGPEHLSMLVERRGEPVRRLREIGLLPPEHIPHEGPEIGDTAAARDTRSVGTAPPSGGRSVGTAPPSGGRAHACGSQTATLGPGREEGPQRRLLAEHVGLHMALRLFEGGNRHDEADRLHEPQPRLMKPVLGREAARGHVHHPVTGQR